MKNGINRFCIIGYLIALVYFFLGAFFFDWSTNMVPFGKDSPRLQVILTIGTELYYIALGITAFLAVFMVGMVEVTVFSTIFWLGVGVVVIGAIGYLVSAVVSSPSIYFFGLMMQSIFLLPATFLYFNRRKIITQ